METGLIAARFFHFAAVMALFGLALFPLYSYPGRAGELPARLGRWLNASLRLAVLLAIASGPNLGIADRCEYGRNPERCGRPGRTALRVG